jgi:hypothetical protein
MLTLVALDPAIDPTHGRRLDQRRGKATVGAFNVWQNQVRAGWDRLDRRVGSEEGVIVKALARIVSRVSVRSETIHRPHDPPDIV